MEDSSTHEQRSEEGEGTKEEHHLHLRANISVLVSSFNKEVGHLLQLLNRSACSESVVSGISHAHHAAQVQKCFRNMQAIFSRQTELEYMWNGLLRNAPSVDDESSPKNIEANYSDEEGNLRSWEEVQLFVADLVKLACVENCWDDPTASNNAESTLQYLIVFAISTLLPNITSVCPLNLDQAYMLLQRVLFLMQDIIEEYSYVNGNLPSPESLQDLKLLECLVTLVTDKVSVEQLQQIVDPTEAIPVLKIPLELACSSGKVPLSTDDDAFQNGLGVGLPVSPVFSLPPELLYAVRVLVDFLFQNLNETISREHERISDCQTFVKPSIREWIRQKESDIQFFKPLPSTGEGNNGAYGTQSQNLLAYGSQRLDSTRAGNSPKDPEDENPESSQGFNIKSTDFNSEHLLSLLDQYGTALIDETMQLLQSTTAAANTSISNMSQSDAEIDYHMETGEVALIQSEETEQMYTEESAHMNSEETSERPTEDIVPKAPKLRRAQIESVIQMVHMSTDFLLYMDSENAIAENPNATSVLRSLWIGMSNFIVDHMSEPEIEDICEDYEYLEDLQVASTEILFRLTKSHFGVLLASDTAVIFPDEDEEWILATMIFRLMRGPGNNDKRNEDGRDWMAFLWEKCRNQPALERTLYTVLSTLAVSTSELQEDEENEAIKSNFFSILDFMELDPSTDRGDDEHDDPEEEDDDDEEEEDVDYWKSYMQHKCFSSA